MYIFKGFTTQLNHVGKPPETLTNNVLIIIVSGWITLVLCGIVVVLSKR